MAGEGQWVAGGELGGHDRSAQEFKQIILEILQEGETVTRCDLDPTRLLSSLSASCVSSI